MVQADVRIQLIRSDLTMVSYIFFNITVKRGTMSWFSHDAYLLFLLILGPYF
jgi:hypothetical protein